MITVSSGPARSVDERLAALRQAAEHRPAIVLVARLTDGLAAADRQTVLAQLRRLAATGPAVLVDDTDPVAALSVADGALRAGTRRLAAAGGAGRSAERLGDPPRRLSYYRAE